MLMIQSVVSALVRANPRTSPQQVVRALNATIFENVRRRLRQSEHATFAIFKHGLDGRVVTAGSHEDIVIYRARERRCEVLPTAGAWVGIVENLGASTTPETTFRLEPGDHMVIYSDGVTEARNVKREQFGTERLCAEIERIGPRAAPDVCQAILDRVLGWQSLQEDDITILVARYLG
jgi:sigma-B regulation protein RsbU (phosphoserine phosphatase)